MNTVVDSNSNSQEKYVLFVRHGLTEMNERLESMPWYSENFVDAALWDTRLSDRGIQQAMDVHQKLMIEETGHLALEKIQVLLSSPLTRALHTAELVFNYRKRILPKHIPQIAHPLLRERLYLSSEVGRSKEELQAEFGGWDFTALPKDKPWWYVYVRPITLTGLNAGSGNSSMVEAVEGPDRHSITEVMETTQPTATTLSPSTNAEPMNETLLSQYSEINSIHQSDEANCDAPDPYSYVEWRPRGTYCCEGEPSDVFLERIVELKQYLENRPEQYIAVVAHWGVIRALTGCEFANCEMKLVKTSDFLADPLVSDE